MPTPTSDLACRTVVELVTDYLERALGEGERRSFEAHLARCDGCTTYVEQHRATVDVVGRVPARGLSPAVRERLRAALGEATGGER